MSIGRTQQTYGFNWELAPNGVASVVGYHANYLHRRPWLFETGGRREFTEESAMSSDVPRPMLLTPRPWPPAAGTPSTPNAGASGGR